MEIFLLQDVPGIGKKNDLLLVGDGYALNNLLPRRAALVATPLVRKRYAEFIKRRAEEREHEKAMTTGAVQALTGKSLMLTRKVTKTGKLYAAVTEKQIVEALKEQLQLEVSEDAVKIDAISRLYKMNGTTVGNKDDVRSIPESRSQIIRRYKLFSPEQIPLFLALTH